MEVREAAKEAFGEKAKSATMPFGRLPTPASTSSRRSLATSQKLATRLARSFRPVSCRRFSAAQRCLWLELSSRIRPVAVTGFRCSWEPQLVKLSESSNTAGIQFAAVEGNCVAAASNDNAAPAEEAEGGYNF